MTEDMQELAGSPEPANTAGPAGAGWDVSHTGGPDFGQAVQPEPAEGADAPEEAFDLGLEELLSQPLLREAVRIDPELEQEFKNVAQSLGLTQEGSRELAGLYAHSLARQINALRGEHVESQRKIEEGWISELKADKDFEVQVSRARAAIRTFGGSEIIDVLEQTRLGSHPAFVRFMAKVGASLAEPAFARAQAASHERSPAEVLYPNQGN